MIEKASVQYTAVRAIITNNNNDILLIKEAKNYTDGTHEGRYDLPGGRVQIGESIKAALQREVDEETGLEISIEKVVSVQEWYPVIANQVTQIIGIFMVCHTSSLEVTLSDEHNAYQWVSLDQISSLDIIEPQARALREYQETLESGR